MALEMSIGVYLTSDIDQPPTIQKQEHVIYCRYSTNTTGAVLNKV